MINNNIKSEILKRLRATEQNENVRILMAIESGSRAWGFESTNSDYDVRFIYARPQDWYLTIDVEDKRDVIEYPIVDEIDLNGWDIKKALKLFWKSNPAFIEWIQSPITYIESGNFREQALHLLPQVYSTERGIYHYRSMAKTNYRGYLKAETVPLKKYFYVLRPLLSIRWLETYRTAAPIEFAKVLTLVDDPDLTREINKLLQQKKAGREKGLIPAIPVLNQFIEVELERLETTHPEKSEKDAEIQQLNQLFQQVLKEPRVMNEQEA